MIKLSRNDIAFMKKIPPFTILFILFANLLLVTPANSSEKKLISFGDSLTEGCGIPGEYYKEAQCGFWVGRNDHYPLYLEQAAADDSKDITVFNYGIGGETTVEGLSRLNQILNNACHDEIHYVLILQGTNDLFHHNDEYVVQYNLREMIKLVRSHEIEPLIATITPDPDNTWKNIDLMNGLIRNLASEENVILVDLYNELASDWEYYTDPMGCYMDKLHPNPYGFQQMALAWYTSLKDYLKNPNPAMPWLYLLTK